MFTPLLHYENIKLVTNVAVLCDSDGVGRQDAPVQNVPQDELGPRDQLSRNQLPLNQLPIGSIPIKSTSHEINCNIIRSIFKFQPIYPIGKGT